MKKIFIKYNPYKLETEITVDGKGLAQNSKLGEKAADGSRLQEWVEDLPRILVDEYNDTEFEVRFHGTLPDYEDLTVVFAEAAKQDNFTARLDRIPAKETSDKEALIDKVFQKILAGPFDELRDDEIRSAFRHAKSSDFEVCVVATMSAGKSTLINAMLGTKLMPSKQEACTAIITRIKDCSQSKVPFKAEVYGKDGILHKTYENLTYQIMERLNADKNVSLIKANGNIPFVSSEDVSLVLIDTPGPNNSRDRNNEIVQRELLGKSSKALVLYIMTGEFGTDDDNTLLKRVAESMAVGGKQSKDRFIFVVNKLDERKEEDGDTSHTLERIRAYLKTHGIVNPNLFPASALSALNLRMIENGAAVDENTTDETNTKVKKLNRSKELHFEEYAVLPPSIRGEINEELEIAKAGWDNENRKNENPREALIHTGIVSIEASIRQYVHKYAKTAKIKNIVDTFIHKLDAVGCFEETKRELAGNQTESEKIVERIHAIHQKMDSAEEAKKYKDAVDDAVMKINDESKKVIEGIIQKFQVTITKRIDELRNSELTIDEAEFESERLKKFAKKLEPDFEVELDELIRKNLVDTSAELLKNYLTKLASLRDEMNTAEFTNITIDPLKLMGGNVNMDDFSTHKYVQDKTVEDGESWVSNPDYGIWYKPWTFFTEEEGYWRAKYKTVKYVAGYALAQDFFRPVQQSLFENGKSAGKYAVEQSKRIIERFNAEFKNLDAILRKKFAELESCATEKEKADERVKKSEHNLQWLEKINADVETILEI
jgi:predicted GTPase